MPTEGFTWGSRSEKAEKAIYTMTTYSRKAANIVINIIIITV